MNLRLAIIGCGYWGPNFIRIINQTKNCELKAVCDLSESRLVEIQSSYPQLRVTKSHEDISNDKNIDAVVIATPVKTHYEVARKALESGKHVLCEKPLSFTSAETIALKKIAESNNLVLMAGHVFEFNSAVQYAKTKLMEGYLGDIIYIHFKRSGLGPVRDDVNVFWDLASHDLSILLYLVNEMPSAVSAFGKCFINSKTEDVGFIILEYPNKLLVNIHVSWLDPLKERNMTVVGTKRMLVFNDVSLTEKIKIFEKGVSYQTASGDFGEFQLAVKDGDTLIPNIKYKEPLKAEFEHFVQCIMEKKTPQTGAESALKVIRILEAAQQSLDNNSKKIQLQ